MRTVLTNYAVQHFLFKFYGAKKRLLYICRKQNQEKKREGSSTFPTTQSYHELKAP